MQIYAIFFNIMECVHKLFAKNIKSRLFVIYANNKKPGADTICQHPACITVGKEDVS